MENELQLFEAQLKKEHTRGLWREAADNPGESRAPKPLAQPYVWMWETVSKLLEQAVSVVAQGDTAVLPSWAWHQFTNPTSVEAILLSINDRPILGPLGLYREEAQPEA